MGAMLNPKLEWLQQG